MADGTGKRDDGLLEPTPGATATCGNCGRSVSSLPCPHCAGESLAGAIVRERDGTEWGQGASG